MLLKEHQDGGLQVVYFKVHRVPIINSEHYNNKEHCLWKVKHQKDKIIEMFI